MNGTPIDQWTEHVNATLDALYKAMGAQTPFPWTPPGGLSEESDDEKGVHVHAEQQPPEVHVHALDCTSMQSDNAA